MSPDTVRIGPWLFSKSVIDAVLPLIGALIGAFVSYRATVSADTRRWKREKAWKRKEATRGAVGLALEWISPCSRR